MDAFFILSNANNYGPYRMALLGEAGGVFVPRIFRPRAEPGHVCPAVAGLQQRGHGWEVRQHGRQVVRARRAPIVRLDVVVQGQPIAPGVIIIRSLL